MRCVYRSLAVGIPVQKKKHILVAQVHANGARNSELLLQKKIQVS